MLFILTSNKKNALCKKNVKKMIKNVRQCLSKLSTKSLSLRTTKAFSVAFRVPDLRWSITIKNCFFNLFIYNSIYLYLYAIPYICDFKQLQFKGMVPTKASQLTDEGALQSGNVTLTSISDHTSETTPWKHYDQNIPEHHN